MFVGLAAIPYLEHHFVPPIIGDINLYSLPAVLAMVGLTSFIVSIVVEWPFCLWAMRRQPESVRRSFLATATAQTASYALLIPLYLIVSDLSLYTGTTVDPLLVSQAPGNVVVYFISPKDGDLYRIRLNGSQRERVHQLGATNWYARLFVRRSQGSNQWDLWVWDGSDPVGDHPPKRLIERFAIQAAIPEDIARGQAKTDTYITADEYVMSFARSGHARADELRPEGERNWEIIAAGRAYQGLYAATARESIRLGIDAPFLRWRARNATALPGDKVVYQLGSQIVLLDLNTRKIGLIAFGRSPIVVLGESNR